LCTATLAHYAKPAEIGNKQHIVYAVKTLYCAVYEGISSEIFTYCIGAVAHAIATVECDVAL